MCAIHQMKITPHLDSSQELKSLEGQVFDFIYGGKVLDSDNPLLIGEIILLPISEGYPKDAPEEVLLKDLEMISTREEF